MEVVVLNCWVTATNEIDRASKASTSLEVGERLGQAVDLVDDHYVDPAAIDVDQELFQGGAIEVAAGIGGVIVMLGEGLPAL